MSESFENKLKAYVTELMKDDNLDARTKDRVIGAVTKRLEENYNDPSFGGALNQNPKDVETYNQLSVSKQAQVDILAVINTRKDIAYKATDEGMENRSLSKTGVKDFLIGERQSFAESAKENTPEFRKEAAKLKYMILTDFVPQAEREVKEAIKQETQNKPVMNAAIEDQVKALNLSHMPQLKEPSFAVSQKGKGDQIGLA